MQQYLQAGQCVCHTVGNHITTNQCSLQCCAAFADTPCQKVEDNLHHYPVLMQAALQLLMTNLSESTLHDFLLLLYIALALHHVLLNAGLQQLGVLLAWQQP